ncbi:MAG: IS1 family transposase [Cenarchaeum sp. SB0665_bin_23]|nr:IS1 family transposase [Cenarchaeum sp. SB0667_bin_13]MXY60571.1 IS1 family transposase [Cenarchaeum sp. SB0665_bin_23]MXZ93141.1 IS1 family transposase [Cenarchaeum sp. SB0666_bin_15]MYB46242.1 IS1 family transposase [Cenarchaeum sp. SB0662_bin_33]MYC80317.1 IS1 family transposase [Cenarchaeum sp. SB0661_bin_35]MYD59011.1 IS1 family transposase [Cenarchaeum sp. SB0678_bin_8]MYG33483.1 IS1 family transposase [Cenarchaeum sp. SB0677_bin_16]MYI51335.1 IS1 family transposase [Cenarchaeum sp.
MACGKTQKQKESGPLLLLLALFADMVATAELFRTVRWANGLFCPRCGGVDIVRYCRYQGHIRRYTCKGCRQTFNDKTGTILHYLHVRMGDWMLAIWMFLCGPPNGISINYIATSIGNAYGAVY